MRAPRRPLFRVLLAATVTSAVAVPLGMPTVHAVAATGMVTCTAPGSAPPSTGGAAGGFTGQVPERLVDTRAASPVPAGCWVRVPLPASVPPGATAVAVTLTADRAAAPGFLTLHPCGSALPATSNLNVSPSGPTSNLVVAPVDATRELCVFSDRGTDVIVDLVGSFGASGAPFHEVTPARAVDTRDPARRPAGVTGTVKPGQTAGVERDVLAVPPAATAVVVNLTVTQAAGPGYLTAFPCGSARPDTSNVNYAPGVDRANTAVMALGPQGSLCFETAEAAAHVVVDVLGWFGPGGTGDLATGTSLQASTGRIADSRNGLGGWSGRFVAGEERALDPAATGVLPGGTRVALLSVVATRTAAAGFLAVRPCGVTSEVSSVNFVAGSDIANVVAVPLGDDGRVCVSSSAPTDVVVDVLGGFTAPGPVRALEIGALDLWPAFDPAITDYAAWCPQQTANAFAFDVHALPGTTIEVVVDGTVRAAGTARLSASVLRDADQAVVLRLTPPGLPPTESWIRCLPPDFPTISTSRSGPTTPGYYLLTTNEFGIIVDRNGVPVWYRRADAPALNPRNLMRLGPDELAWFQDRGFALGVNPADGYERFHLDGTSAGPLLKATVGPTNHHDLVPLPNGHFLVQSMPALQGAPTNTSACSVNGATQPFPTDAPNSYMSAAIQEVDASDVPVGAPFVVPDALAEGGNTVRLCFRQGGDASKDYLTLVHINAMTAAGDLVAFSARHHDAVYLVDWSNPAARTLIGKIGGSPGGGVTTIPIVGDPFGGPLRQHDVHLEASTPGHYRLTMFDNRTQFTFATPVGSGPARFVEYDLDMTDPTAPVVTFVRHILRPDGFFSGSLGSARIQPDGAVVVGWGGVPGPTFTEFSPTGQVLFELTLSPFANGNASYRAIKEPLDAFDLARLRQTAGS